ncbi:MAG: VanW family protein [Coriobacteriia bacterium]|nr:VanW family protein [Coriobacteriia bacterium]
MASSRSQLAASSGQESGHGQTYDTNTAMERGIASLRMGPLLLPGPHGQAVADRGDTRIVGQPQQDVRAAGEDRAEELTPPRRQVRPGFWQPIPLSATLFVGAAGAARFGRDDDVADFRARQTFAHSTAGAAYRRLRRELQWRTAGGHYRVRRAVEGAFGHTVAEHATPLVRDLVGLDPALQRNKVTNLRLAAERLDGIVLEPGVRLSFWREVGRPSYRRGFLDGLVLDHGRLTAGVGGGLCQLTNLLYWMTLHTPLQVTERWRHSYDVFPDAGRTQPFGSGATCAWPSLDLQIENVTGVPYRLRVALTDTLLTGAWQAPGPPSRRYVIEERSHRITHEGPGAYVRRNELWRLEHDLDGLLVTQRRVAVNDALMMYEPFLPPAVP